MDYSTYFIELRGNSLPWMHLRNNTILKFFAILLFSFELLAPSVLGANIEIPVMESTEKISIHQSAIMFSSFLLEERSEEEREGKDINLISFDFYLINWVTVSSKITDHQRSIFSNKEQYNTHPPFFILHHTFLI